MENSRPVLRLVRGAAEATDAAEAPDAGVVGGAQVAAGDALVPARTLGAVELVPGRVRAALVSMSGTVLRRTTAEYARTAGCETVAAALTDAVTRCFREHRPDGIGVAAAGVVDPERGTFVEVHDVPALRDFPVTATVRALVGVPVRVEHLARVQVLGDRWFGPGRGRRAFASVSTGDVLGVGLLYEGRVVAPPGGRSGAHMTVAASGERCTCGAHGCWKTVATTRWLRSGAAAAGLGEGMTLRDLVASGAPRAEALLDQYAENIALGLANIQQLFAPGLFVLHGEARDGGEEFRARIEERLLAHTGPATGEAPWVVTEEVSDDDIALRGGAGLVLTHG